MCNSQHILGMLRVLALALPVLAVDAACNIIQDNDYDQGSGGPNFPAANSSVCCSLCVTAGSAACYAAVFDPMTGGVCWYKTAEQTKKPVYSAGLSACWPPGSVPPPSPSSPPPPPPPLYAVNVTALPAYPVISNLTYSGATPSQWQQSFNPSFIEASPGTHGVRGLIVRSQNCSFTPGTCVKCNGGNPFVGSVMSFAAQAADGTFSPPYLVYAPLPGLAAEDLGTEDPRVAYDATTGLYHMFYTCYGTADGGLCHSTTLDPTAPYPGNWTRHGVMFPGKSAALLIRPSPPHYLYQGDSAIRLLSTTDLYNYTLLNASFIATRQPPFFDTELVEAGPPPLLLVDGNYIFFHNSAGVGGYHPEYVILNGTDPTQILQRAQTPLLSPTRIWETGTAPAECNVPDVVFLEAAAPVTDGTPNTFDVWFGGSDAVVGTARVTVTALPPPAKH